MQDSFDKYHNYKATDFGLDDDFIDWVLFPTEEKDAYWNSLVKNTPAQKRNIGMAKSIILSFDNTQEKVPEEIKRRIWEVIISKSGNGHIVKMRHRNWWMVAASVLIIIVAAFTFIYINKSGNNKDHDLVRNVGPKSDIVPGGNKAVLTLANGNTIVLDSAQNGTLSQQGNSKVVKLDNGKLIYQKDLNEVSNVEQFNTITTPRGGQYQLVLADGSKAWLNAASSIRFPTAFNGNKREVTITGEAYFEIAHDASKPFHVSVNGSEVVVLGTHFNVNDYEDEGIMKTTLLEGSVKVSHGDDNVTIAPGEQAQINNSSDKIAIKKDVDVQEVVAWKNGKFIFEDADIISIMKQLERWYNIKVSYVGTPTKEQFEGVISRNVNISQILNMLEKTGAVKFEIKGKEIIVN